MTDHLGNLIEEVTVWCFTVGRILVVVSWMVVQRNAEATQPSKPIDRKHHQRFFRWSRFDVKCDIFQGWKGGRSIEGNYAVIVRLINIESVYNILSCYRISDKIYGYSHDRT